MRSAPSINLGLREQLNKRDFRTAFFLAEAGAQIAAQLISLRKLRKVSQAKLAEEIDTKQSGISRVESADYGNWNFNTLRKIAAALDGRLRITIEPAENVLGEYIEPSEDVPRQGSAALADTAKLVQQDLSSSIMETSNSGKLQDGSSFVRGMQSGIIGKISLDRKSAISA